MQKSWWLIGGGIVAATLAIFLVVGSKSAQVVVIGKSATGTNGTAAGQNSPTSSTSPNLGDPQNTSGQVLASATSVFPYYPGSAVPLTDQEKVAYNAKVLALANLQIASKKHITTSTIPGTKIVTSTIYYTTSTVANGWPAKNAAYPNEGVLLPNNRIVAYYGNLYSKQMGVLGQYPQAQVLAMLASTTAAWAAADPSTPVVPALDYIAVSAQASPGSDGDYRLRMPDNQIDQVLSMAQQVHGIVFLDIQVGLSNVETEVPIFKKYLSMPNVELSLDPEFDMHNGQRPGTVIGTMDASDINWAAQYIANLVREYNLPPKILVVHRFTQDMVTNTSKITPLPEVQIVMDMDGFGFPAKKINTYQQVIVPYPIQFTGFKLFYHNDTLGPSGHLMTPEEVLKLSPQPSYIQYQ